MAGLVSGWAGAGGAELVDRFIGTLVEGWAYGVVKRTSSERTAALAGWLDWYNRLRLHRTLGRKPPLSRLAEMNNVVGTNS